MGFDLKNDLLEPYFHKRELTEEAFDIIFNDTINKPDPQRTYHVTAKAIVTDYLNETYSGEWNLSPCRMREPLRFLEFSLPDFQLDPNKYIERPKLENRNTTGSISLTFLVNKAELDPQDPNNEAQMNKLRNDLMAVINGEGTTLKEFKIVGISSPEGRYDANMSLSKRRTRFASQQISSMIPAGRWSRVYKPTETRVATWNEVADLLEKDTLLTEAKEIREITEKYQSQDAQFAVIRKLPYYETIIKERLPRLRSVQYEYKYSILRELNPDEILDRYRNDPDYRNGKKQFTKYEYWQLFQMLKDTKEAEKIYKRAYEETMSYNSNGEKVPWILAANNWAVSLLKRDTFDVEILKPLIHPNRPVNYIDKFDDGVKIIETEINPEVIVANQMAMYLRAKQNKEAAILAQILPDTEKFRMLKAFSKCLRGFYNYRAGSSMQEIEERKKIFELVKNSSPMNHVIICMAMKTDQYNREAKRVLEEELPVNTLTKYLKVQLFIRESNLPSPKFVDPYSEEGIAYKKACSMLDEIIKEDPKYKKIIESDGEFSEEFIEFFNDPINWQY